MQGILVNGESVNLSAETHPEAGPGFDPPPQRLYLSVSSGAPHLRFTRNPRLRLVFTKLCQRLLHGVQALDRPTIPFRSMPALDALINAPDHQHDHRCHNRQKYRFHNTTPPNLPRSGDLFLRCNRLLQAQQSILYADPRILRSSPASPPLVPRELCGSVNPLINRANHQKIFPNRAFRELLLAFLPDEFLPEPQRSPQNSR